MLDQNKLQELRKKAEELHRIVQDINAILKTFTIEIVAEPKGEPLLAQPKQELQNHESTVETVKAALPADIQPLLDITEQHTNEQAWIQVKPLLYLGPEKFPRLADAIKQLDGDYVSMGKESHWRIPVPKRQQT